MNYIFFFEDYNDLDMGAPIAWKATTRANAHVIIVNANPRHIRYDDFRYIFLREQKNVSYYEIGSFPSGFLSRARYWLRENLLHKRILKLSQEELHKNDLENFDFNDITIDISQPTAVHFFYDDGHIVTRKAKQWALNHNYSIIACQHGLKTVNVPGQPINVDQYVDAYMINHQSYCDCFTSKQTGIFYEVGAPRYSLEWSAVYDTIIPKWKNNYSGNRFTILFTLSKYKNDDSKELILEAIDKASEIDNSLVLVKPHTRGMGFRPKNKKPNIKVLSSKYHSRALIRQSDVLVYTKSCIFMDAILMHKPALRLAYASKLKHLSRCLDEIDTTSVENFIDRLRNIQSGETSYTAEARKKAMTRYIGHDNGDLLDRFILSIEKITQSKCGCPPPQELSGGGV